jgi:hypothetical protein
MFFAFAFSSPHVELHMTPHTLDISFDVAGITKRAAIQAGIDRALAAGIPVVRIPPGTHELDDTIHIGTPILPFASLTLEGAGIYTETNFRSVELSGKYNDRPILNIQTARGVILRGLTFIGNNQTPKQIVDAENKKQEKDNDKVNDGAIPASFPRDPNRWLDEAMKVDVGSNRSGGLSRYAPNCGVSIDAYSGRVALGRYPNADGPDAADPWITKYVVSSVAPRFSPTVSGSEPELKDGETIEEFWGPPPTRVPIPDDFDPANTGGSSNVRIEGCRFINLAVGLCLTPNGSTQQGDFLRIRDSSFVNSVYGIAVCGTQSRNVEIANCNFAGLHTFVTNSVFGLGNGRLDGTFQNISGGQGYQVFDCNGAQGPLHVRHLYVERQVRIGRLASSRGASVAGPVTFDSCTFNLQVGGDRPISLVDASAYSTIAVKACVFSLARNSMATFASGNPNIIWTANLVTVDHDTEMLAPGIAEAMEYCGGLLLHDNVATMPWAVSAPSGNRVRNAAGIWIDMNDMVVMTLSRRRVVCHQYAKGWWEGYTNGLFQGSPVRILQRPIDQPVTLGANEAYRPAGFARHAAFRFPSNETFAIGDLIVQHTEAADQTSGLIFVVTAPVGPDGIVVAVQMGGLKGDGTPTDECIPLGSATRYAHLRTTTMISQQVFVAKFLEKQDTATIDISALAARDGGPGNVSFESQICVGDQIAVPHPDRTGFCPIRPGTTIEKIEPIPDSNSWKITIKPEAVATGIWPLLQVVTDVLH